MEVCGIRMNQLNSYLNGKLIALVNPGPPGTCGGVIAAELQNNLSQYCNVEHVFVEEKEVCKISDWGDEPVIKVPFSIKKMMHWQAHRKMRKYDLYHYQSQRNLGLLKYDRKPGILTCHGLAPLKADDVYTEGTKRRFHQQFRYLDQLEMIIANSKDTAGDLVRILNVPVEKIEVIYFGVNHNIFKPRPIGEIREQLGLDSDAMIILNVGTERKNKNIERLMQVFKKLSVEMDNLYLVRVGDKDPYFTEMLEKMNLADKVIRPGRLSSPALYYNAADVYLCMDLHASFGMPNLEAMASGCPVVTSNVEAIPEIVGDSCRLVDPKNVEEIAENLIEVLRSETCREDLRKKGLDRASSFTWDETAKKTAEVYARILK